MKKDKNRLKYTITIFQSMDSLYGKSKVKNDSMDSYETTDKKTCLEILRDYTDYADYDLTEENIRKNLGVGNIRQKYMSQIILYYSMRKLLFGDLKKHVEDGICGMFRYDIPEEVNSYVLNEDGEKFNKKNKERIYLSYIELKMEKT